MRKIKVIMAAIGIFLIFGVIGHGYSEEKDAQEVPERVTVGQWELKLLWQKDLRGVFGREVALGSYGNLGPAITMSSDGQYIGVDIHPWDRKTYAPPPEDSKGVFYFLNREGEILWSKRLGEKQRGMVSKNGSTVLLDVARDELDTEFFVFDITGKQIGHGRQPYPVELSGNGEYILAFSLMAVHEAVLYDKRGRLVWRHTFKNPWGGNAKIMDSGNVVLFDKGDILLKRPNGQVLWRLPNPTKSRWFDIPDDATAEEPNIVIYTEEPEDRSKDHISLLNRKGKVIWEVNQFVDTPSIEYFSVSFSKKSKRIASVGWREVKDRKISGFWVWDTRSTNPIIEQAVSTYIAGYDLHPSGNVLFVQGRGHTEGDPGWCFDNHLLLLDLESHKTAQIPSYHFSLSPDGTYIAVGSPTGKISFYSVKKR